MPRIFACACGERRKYPQRLVRRVDVVGVLARTGQEAHVLLAPDRLADDALVCRAHVVAPATCPSRWHRPAPRGRCCGSRCSGRSCLRALRGSPARRPSDAAATRSMALITMPGVQKPHCRPWHSLNAACIGCIVPSAAREALDGGDLRAVGLRGEHVARLDGAAVEMDRARAALARCRSPRACRSSARSLRRNSTSSVRGSTSAVTALPLTVNESLTDTGASFG